MSIPQSFIKTMASVSAALLVLVAGTAASAQFDLELAGVSGIIQNATIVGDIYIPATPGEQDARLLVQGMQALGYRDWWCPPYSPLRPAAEFRLSLSFIAWPDTVEWLRGSLHLPEMSGYFEVTMALHDLSAPDGPVTWMEGGHLFRLRIGSAGGISICYEDLLAPSVSIYAARLVSSPTVASETSSWGDVKCLFR